LCDLFLDVDNYADLQSSDVRHVVSALSGRGAENAGVENAGGITRGNPSEEMPLNTSS